VGGWGLGVGEVDCCCLGFELEWYTGVRMDVLGVGWSLALCRCTYMHQNNKL
jgi:hypothetical protein